MNLKLLFFICFIVFVMPSQAQWKKVFTTNSQDLYGVQLIDVYAFAVGQNNTILKSVDTGKTWKNQFLSIPTNLRALCFLDTNIGFIIGENARIFKTVNGGKNWISKYVRTAAYGYGITFNGQNGLAVGADLLIVSTKDLGENWIVDTTFKANITLKSTCITSAGDCFAVGDSGYILKKNINRNKWQKLPFQTNINLTKVLSFNDSVILIFGGMRDSTQVGKHLNIILKSTDAGKTWQKTVAPEMKTILNAWFKNQDTGFLVGTNGIISRVYEPFSSRNQMLSGISSDINEVSFNGSVGLGVSFGGVIIRTSNFGGYALNIKENHHDVEFFPNPSNGIINLKTKQELVKIEVFNALGLVKSIDVSTKNHQLDLSELNNGCYFMKIFTTNGILQIKPFIISKN